MSNILLSSIWQNPDFDKFWPELLKTRIARIARGSHTEGFPKSGHILSLFQPLPLTPSHQHISEGPLQYGDNEAVYVQLFTIDDTQVYTMHAGIQSMHFDLCPQEWWGIHSTILTLSTHNGCN